MAKVIWSPSSLEDIDFIAGYISKDSVYQASLFIDRLFETTDRLKMQPLSGRIIPEMNNKNCREVIYGAFRIMYRIEKGNVWITGVIHGARNWKPPVE